MQGKVLSTVAAASMALSLSATASFAGYMQPGETMGVSLVSPLPEGVYFADLEDYGRSPNLVPGTNVGLGVNIPVIIWSTPISFYNTRLEALAALPFAHIDGGGLDRFGAITYALGPLLAHDFGNGLTGGVGALVRTPDPSANIQDLSGRTRPGADFRQSLQYKIPEAGPFGGITLIENAAFTSCFCRNVPITGDGLAVAPQNDMFAGDFTAEKTFGKFTIGFTGYGNIDTNNIARLTVAGTNGNTRERNVAVGGLIGYDFGKFTLTGIVTHSLYRNAIVPAVSSGEETRGWLRIIVPLYVAPAPAAPVVARY
jgi:hypothetical protein